MSTSESTDCTCERLRQECGIVRLRSGKPWYCSLTCYEFGEHVRECSYCEYVRPIRIRDQAEARIRELGVRS